MASGTPTNGVIMPSNMCFQFLQPNTGRVHNILKSKVQLINRLRPQPAKSRTPLLLLGSTCSVKVSKRNLFSEKRNLDVGRQRVQAISLRHHLAAGTVDRGVGDVAGVRRLPAQVPAHGAGATEQHLGTPRSSIAGTLSILNCKSFQES